MKWAAPAGATVVGCALTKSSTQSIANTTTTDVTFDQEDYDTDGFHSTVSNTARITIPSGKGGKYLVIARITFVANSTGARVFWLNKNNGTYIGFCSSAPPQSNDDTTLQVTHIADLAAGDYITISGYQGSGNNLNVNSGQGRNFFSVQYLGA